MAVHSASRLRGDDAADAVICAATGVHNGRMKRDLYTLLLYIVAAAFLGSIVWWATHLALMPGL